ncbi:tyrosine--tRNA ligase [Chondrinema litorale]|uniref:tyrosine--tRNA ligase n=1 Tax=Chondrinema litorale TaxID=2994555 RepID=UPI0025436CCF|nr:tyrosine--tRNA ligase [Chondrinema litorale]UZR95127.1 tyrosine--tRNA ligase [Chondrinema litorale]
MKDLLDELSWRGMVHDTTPGLKEHFEKGMVKGYIGFDPTASSLHIGNLATVMLLKQLQLAGGKPYALVGGATGMIGDPSGKSKERNLLDETTLRENQAGVKSQLEKFLDFDCGDNSAVIVNNYDWFKEIGFLQFLRNVGKHLSVSYMMAKDSVKSRLEDKGISFTEFSYQLLQAYDFCHLYKEDGITLQMGGSDQWGNITSGTELIRRMESGEAYALTTPLLTKADGSKFGKSEAGNVWLDAERTSPYKFYQFWLNIADTEISKVLRVFTLFSQEEIEAIEKENENNPNALKRIIAQDITTRIHSEKDYENAVSASEILFKKSGVTEALRSLDEKLLLEVFEGVDRFTVSKDSISGKPDVLTFLAEQTSVFSSKGEARKMIANGGVSINKEKIAAADALVDHELLQGKYLLVQKGKKNYYLIEAE